MKSFIYLCCISHLLIVISARFRLTTPLPSPLRLNDDSSNQTSNIAEIIDFVNSVYNSDDRSIARRDRYDPMLRRFHLSAVKDVNIPPSAVVPNDEDAQNQLKNIAGTARYQVIDNPEVLEAYSNKQKQKNNEELLKSVSVNPDTSAEAKSFSTLESKLRYYHSKSALRTGINNNKFDEFLRTPNPSPLDSVQELTTVKSTTYRPSFPDDDDDDDDIQVTVTEKKIRAEAKNHDDLKINKAVEIEKKILDNNASSKEDQARIEEEKAPMDNTKETGQMKHELPLKDKNNDDVGGTVGVTVNEEKSGSNKRYKSSKLDYNTNERPSEDKVRPRDEDYKNDGNKNMSVTTDMNNEKDNKPKIRSLDTNKVKSIPEERLMGIYFQSALRTNQGNNDHDHMEHSTYSHKERNENSNKQFKNNHEKRAEYDRKKKDKKEYNRWSNKENDWKKNDNQRYNKDYGFDRMEHEWNNRHRQYDENDNWNIHGNQWDKNDNFDSRDRDSNKRNNDWDKKDNDWKKKGNEWKKRDFGSNKRGNHWNERDIDSNNRESDWNKRDSKWIKQDSNTYKDDQNDNDVDRKLEWDYKYTRHTTVDNDGSAHDRYEIVERNIKNDDNRNYEI